MSLELDLMVQDLEEILILATECEEIKTKSIFVLIKNQIFLLNELKKNQDSNFHSLTDKHVKRNRRTRTS